MLPPLPKLPENEVERAALSQASIFANLGCFSKHDVDDSENVSSRFCDHFSIIPSHYSCKMCSKYLGIKGDKIEDFLSSDHVFYTSAKQIISRRRKDENGYKICIKEKCTCKISKFVTF